MSALNEQHTKEAAAASASPLSPEVGAVFAAEQQGWREYFLPEGIVKAGDTLEDFTLPDATGAQVTLSELLSDGPAVIFFYRGGWCPYCNVALRTYETALLPQLERYAARLVAISPQNPDQSL